MWSAESRSEFHRHSEIVLGRHDAGVVVDVRAVGQGDEAGFPNAAVLEIEQVFHPGADAELLAPDFLIPHRVGADEVVRHADHFLFVREAEEIVVTPTAVDAQADTAAAALVVSIRGSKRLQSLKPRGDFTEVILIGVQRISGQVLYS